MFLLDSEQGQLSGSCKRGDRPSCFGATELVTVVQTLCYRPTVVRVMNIYICYIL